MLKGQPLTWTSVDEPTKCLETTYGEVSCITFSLVESGTMFVTFKDEKVAKELVLKGELRVKQAIFTAALHNDADFEGRGEERIDNETTEHDEDRLSHYEQFLNALGLLDYYPNKISISNVMTINMDNGSVFDQDQKKIELTELPWILLRSLLGVYCKARDRVASLIKENATPQEQCTSDWLFADSYDHTEVNPLDLFITVYKCCDPMLKQLLFQKCYSCKIAVPFIHVLHDFSSLSSRSVVSIWPLRSLLIQNRYTNNEAKTNLCVEEEVHEHPTNLITFARIGKSANSKSEMLNGLLSDNNCKTFFDKNCVSQIASHKYSEELVEIFWLPVEGNSMDRFNKPVTFLNCRGSLHQFQTEILEFVSKLTDILVILLDIESLNNSTKYTEDCVSKFSSMIIIVDNPMRRKFKPIMDTFRLKLQAQGKFCELISTYQGERKRNPVEMTEILQRQLQNLLIKLQPLSLYTRITSCSQNIYLDEDSDSCKDGKKCARDIIEEMTKAGSSLEWKRVITPVQTTISNEIAKCIKKQQRLQYATEIRDNEEKLHSLRHSCLDNVTSTVKQFAFYLCETNTYDLSLQYFLGWLNIMLGNIKMSTVQKLQKQNNLEIDILKSSGLSAIDIKKKTDLLLKATEKKIDSSSFSIEHLFREISHIYNVLLILKGRYGLPSVEKMKTTLAELIYIGYTFELVDGDNFFLATHWVEAVFLSLSLKIDHESVLTLSVVGLQSSGKSTLLNTMFGSHFAVSSGRCTKGLNLQLIPMSKRITKQNKFSYVLVVDTEGLRSTEFSDCKLTHDNELATFISGLGDVTILNVMGENICEINDILNVTVHAFIRLKKANKSLDIRKLCYFVHQNVSDILAARNTRPGLRKLLQKLNDATKDAAQVENVPAISQFNEIMEFDMYSQVFLMPTLWQGSSPMTFVNCDYSQHINIVKKKVLQGACEMKKKSYKSLKDFVIHMKDLWTGVLSEDFVFKYRNSLEIKAYYDLNKYFKRAYFKKEGKIYDDCCDNANVSFSRSVDINQLDTDFNKSNLETDETINNEEVNWKLELEDFLSKNLLSDLLSMNNYKLFSEYNQNPKLFAAQWITKRSNAFLFDQPSRKYCKMACRYIMEYFEEVKMSVVTTADIFSKRYPWDRKTIKNSSASDDWIDTLSSKLKICILSKSQFDLLKDILRNNDNLENFKELVIEKLNESEHKLIEEFENVDSTTVIWNILDPITEVINETWGCPEECPFCGEPCARDIHDAEKMPHFCIQHKPKGCKGVHFTDSKELSIDTCNFAINSTYLTHTCGVFDYACASGTEKKSCPVGVHRYRDYKMFIKDWDIEPNTDMNAV
ncbi:interferon-induced very large GTPase 1-like, partial [Ruditapes philippinarum]|uniref:interferon-induced very large GTPase 1-like n=1 Tax=Ruditapes philippinarum TaxID=129788 RepID=UPI00295B99CB